MSQPPAGTARSAAKVTPSGSSTASPSVNVQEFAVRIPKNMKKMHHVMRFNATLKVDFAQWKNVKMERENNMRDVAKADEEMPKFGAGSEYNREQKEELRRKKFGFAPRKYKQDAQPWILKVGGKSGKKFRGIREGGVSEYASFYVFAHAPDGAIEAYPLNEWYNFQPVQRYKALSAEEAEHEFGRRNKVMNFFSLMMRNRLKGDEEGLEEPEEAKKKLPGKKGTDLKISDANDTLMDSEDDSDSDNEVKKNDDSDDDKKKKKGKKPVTKSKKKKNKGSDDEAFEESDDGDEEGREMDYIESSESDDSDPELQVDKEMKSVAEEDGLRKLLTSDEDSDEEKNPSDDSAKEDEKNKKEAKENTAKEKKKTKTKKSKDQSDKKESLTDLSSDSSDSEAESKKSRKPNGNSASNSRSESPSMDLLAAGPSGLKRKLPTDLGSAGNSNGASENSNSPTVTPAKKTKYDAPSAPASFSGVINNKDDNGITEDAVRRYLTRKPMTATELLTKFKNKKTGVKNDKLVETMTQILKKINPIKQTIQGKMYLSIKK